MPSAAGLFYSGYTPDESAPGVPIVLVHGAGGSRLDWQFRRVPSSAPVIAVDLPGHGALIGAFGRLTIGAYAEAVVGLLDELHLPGVIIAGHSMGGAIALTLALDYAPRVAGMILIGTGARLRVHPTIIEGIVREPEATARQIATLSWSVKSPPAVRQQMVRRLLAVSPTTLRDDFRACNAFDVVDRVGSIHTPTLILVGAEDQMTPPKYSAFLAERIAGARMAVIPNAGHMVTLEQPDAVSSQIITWLNGLNLVDAGAAYP
ncbi:MAG: alpha/beta fold hydrolase [Aggregatilineales bacterium]